MWYERRGGFGRVGGGGDGVETRGLTRVGTRLGGGGDIEGRVGAKVGVGGGEGESPFLAIVVDLLLSWLKLATDSMVFFFVTNPQLPGLKLLLTLLIALLPFDLHDIVCV